MSSQLIGREDGLTKRTLHLRIPPDAVFARTVRDALIGFGMLHEIADGDVEALLFAVGEALANAIEHAATGLDIEVFAEVDDESIVATVVDHGRGLHIVPQQHMPPPESLAQRGRGIPIMQGCSDFMNVNSTPGHGTAVTLGRWRRGYENTEQGTVS